MIPSKIKNYIRFQIYRVRYPKAKIAMGTWIDQETTIGDQVIVHANSHLSKSSIGNNAVIGGNCGITRAVIGEHITVGSNNGLSNVKLDRFSYLAGKSALVNTKLGSFCSIGPELICGIGDHPTNFVSTHPVFFLP